MDAVQGSPPGAGLGSTANARRVAPVRAATATALAVALTLVLLLGTGPGPCAAQNVKGLQVFKLNMSGTIDTYGVLRLQAALRLAGNADYQQLKRTYPNPYVLMRDLVSSRASFVTQNAKAEYRDATNSLAMSMEMPGAAVIRKRLWEVEVGKKLDVVYQGGNRIILLGIQQLDDVLLVTKTDLKVPDKATELGYSADTGVVSYALPVPAAPGRPQLDLQLKCQPRISAAVYKVYANRELQSGAFWVAKAVFKNTGKANVRDLEIKYRMGPYADWSPGSKYSCVVPGGTVVDVYYPVLSSKVCELRTATPVDLEVKYTYKDESGKVMSDSDGARISILGVNQMEWSNILPEERLGTWHDNFSNGPLVAGFVTRLDEPVKAFAGMASQLAGGVSASSDDDSAVAFCRAVYDLEVANGVSYQTPSGFLSDVGGGQDVKYPRDLLRDKAGTCLDLAITFAATCEAVGLQTLILLIPGHSYPLIVLPSGNVLPVETTGVGGAAQGKAATFDEAVRKGQKNLPQDLSDKPHIIVDVEQLWRDGVANPELPRLESNVLTEWGWKMPQTVGRDVAQAPAQAAAAPAGTGGTGAACPPGTTTPTATATPTQPGGTQTPAPTSTGTTPDVGGLYRGVLAMATGQATLTATIQQSGNALRGDMAFDVFTIGNVHFEGSISGSSVQWTCSLLGFPAVFKGQVSGGVIQGLVQFTTTGEQGEFRFVKY